MEFLKSSNVTLLCRSVEPISRMKLGICMHESTQGCHNYHPLVAETTEIHCLTVLETRNPILRCQHGQSLMRALSLGCRWSPSHRDHTCLVVSFYEDTNPDPRALPLCNSTATAKSLQLCPTLCDPIDGSPPGSPVPGILQARTLTGVGCHFLLQRMQVKSEREVVQSCLTLSNSMDRSRPGSSIHGIFQARVLEWGNLTLVKLLRRALKRWLFLFSLTLTIVWVFIILSN